MKIHSGFACFMFISFGVDIINEFHPPLGERPTERDLLGDYFNQQNTTALIIKALLCCLIIMLLCTGKCTFKYF